MRIKKIEELEKMESFKYQNDSFKDWCREHQDINFKVIDSDGKSYLFKNCYFWISSEFVEN